MKQGLKHSAGKTDKPIYSVVVLSSFVVLLGLGAGAYWWTNRPLIDQQIINEASFPVYAPRATPDGYKLDSNKTKLDKQMLTYVFSNEEGDKQVTVTVQPMPNGFDMQKLIGSGSINSTTTPLGTLYDLSVSSGSQFLLNTGDALIFLTSTRRIETSTITAIVNDLSKHN